MQTDRQTDRQRDIQHIYSYRVTEKHKAYNNTKRHKTQESLYIYIQGGSKKVSC